MGRLKRLKGKLLLEVPRRWINDRLPGVRNYIPETSLGEKKLLEKTSGTWQSVAEASWRFLTF